MSGSETVNVSPPRANWSACGKREKAQLALSHSLIAGASRHSGRQAGREGVDANTIVQTFPQPAHQQPGFASAAVAQYLRGAMEVWKGR